MARKKVTVGKLAQEASLDLDEVLLILWDNGFDYVNSAGDALARGEANRARRSLGLATRRELASLAYWSRRLKKSQQDILAFLSDQGIPRPLEGNRLTKKAIRLLSVEARLAQLPAIIQGAVPKDGSATPSEELKWDVVGHVRPLRYLSSSEIVQIHEALADDFASGSDPIQPPGVKSQALLESAAGRPQTSLGGQLKYPAVEMAAASLLHAIVHNHPFHNGNKRTALVSMLVFLDENGLIATCSEDGLFKLVLRLAQHALVISSRELLADQEVLHVARWLKEHTRLIEKGDRPIAWRRLRPILAKYDCECDNSEARGGRINISRVVTRSGGFLQRAGLRGPKRVTLQTQVAYGDRGREVDRNTLNKIRHDLELDDDHGIDSAAFYNDDEISPSDFINSYRKTLRRLAKL
jgi:death-on-curing family protein